MVEQLIRDGNHVPVSGGVSSASATTVLPFKIDSVTGRLLVDNSGGGSGTITQLDGGTGILLTPDPITTTGTVALIASLQPLATLGTAGQLIKVNAGATALEYFTATYMTNPMTTGGDIIYGGASGVPTRLANGSVGQVLTSGGTTVAPTWETPGSASDIEVGVTTISSGTTTRILYDNAGVLGEYVISGTGDVAMTNSPIFVDDITVGVGSSATGVIKLVGTTSGTVSLSVADAAGTYTLKLPTTGGNNLEFLQTDGSGNTTWASANTISATTITVENEATDTTCFPIFVTAATGDLAPKSNTGLTFNSNTALLTATLLAGTTSVTSATIRASSNDSGSLGASGTAFSDLFLASGAVIDFAAGNSVITHSSGILTVSTGDLRVTTAGTNTASVVTVGGTQTLTSKTLTSPTINTPTLGGANQLAEGASIRLDQTLSADGTFSGITIAGTAGATLAFGDLIYLATADSRWELADADAAATADVMLGMCVLAAASDGDPTVILLQGNIRADTAFPTMTISARMYMGETAGDIQATIPTGADNVIRAVGYALTADALYFNPSMDSQITVA